jgi:hypothetical protein
VRALLLGAPGSECQVLLRRGAQELAVRGVRGSGAVK